MLPRPDRRTLRQTARLLTGHSPTVLTDDGVARGILSDMLRLACRRRQTADDWLARIIALVRRSAQRPRGVALADLAGMDEVAAWGEALAQDLAGYRRSSVPAD